MRRRYTRDDPDAFAHRDQAADLPLFGASASIEAGMAALADTAAKHSVEIARLVPLARELARRAPEGITVSDLRLYAVQRNLLTGSETGRRLSYLGAVLRAAGLEPTGEYRRSSILKSHGNIHAVHRLPRAQDGAA